MSTLRELIEQAGRLAVYPTYDETISARKELSARLNPQTALLVLNALEDWKSIAEKEDPSLKATNAYASLVVALSALNGTPPTA